MAHDIDGIGERLKAVRARLEYTQKGIAQAAGSKLRSWQDYEKGLKVPGSQVIAGLVGLGINANWVLTGEGPMMLEDDPLTNSHLDENLLALSIEGVDEVCNGRLNPEGKAELVSAIYSLFLDARSRPRKSSIVKFLKSMPTLVSS